MKKKQYPNFTRETLQREREEKNQGIQRPPGYYSNSIIRQRNNGIKHLFEDDIGGCSDNYR